MPVDGAMEHPPLHALLLRLKWIAISLFPLHPKLDAPLDPAHTYVYTHTHTHTHSQTYIHTHSKIYTHARTPTHTHTHTHTHKHIHIYTHTHTHTHTPTRNCETGLAGMMSAQTCLIHSLTHSLLNSNKPDRQAS